MDKISSRISGRQFQLTHLLRGATQLPENLTLSTNFNSRTSCEVRRGLARSGIDLHNFNSRTSCEVRHPADGTLTAAEDFNSRTSCEVRRGGGGGADRQHISTHAPLARCDSGRMFFETRLCDFNSRTSCEVRPIPNGMRTLGQLFQLTHLLRGATSAGDDFC